MTILETFSALKMTASALKSAADLHNQVEIDLRSSEFLRQIDELYSSIFGLYEKNAGLVAEKADLEKKLLSYEQWEKEAARYKLEEIDTQVFVYAYKKSNENQDPLHYLCAKCMHDKKKSILNLDSDHSDGSKSYHCPSCNKYLSTHVKRHISLDPYPGRGRGPQGWMS
jgi:PIN domain nuclease of toxin-antitoxin system